MSDMRSQHVVYIAVESSPDVFPDGDSTQKKVCGDGDQHGKACRQVAYSCSRDYPLELQLKATTHLSAGLKLKFRRWAKLQLCEASPFLIPTTLQPGYHST